MLRDKSVCSRQRNPGMVLYGEARPGVRVFPTYDVGSNVIPLHDPALGFLVSGLVGGAILNGHMWFGLRSAIQLQKPWVVPHTCRQVPGALAQHPINLYCKKCGRCSGGLNLTYPGRVSISEGPAHTQERYAFNCLV